MLADTLCRGSAQAARQATRAAPPHSTRRTRGAHVDEGARARARDVIEGLEADPEGAARGASRRRPLYGLVRVIAVLVLAARCHRVPIEETLGAIREAEVAGVREAVAAENKVDVKALRRACLLHVHANGRHAAVDVRRRQHVLVQRRAWEVRLRDGYESRAVLAVERRPLGDVGDEGRGELAHRDAEKVCA